MGEGKNFHGEYLGILNLKGDVRSTWREGKMWKKERNEGRMRRGLLEGWGWKMEFSRSF